MSISVDQWLNSRSAGAARCTYSPDYIDAVAVQERDLNPACERSERTGRGPAEAGASAAGGCDASSAHNSDDDPPHGRRASPPEAWRVNFGDDDEVVYYLSNALCSVYALADADGNVVERYRYDAPPEGRRASSGPCTVLDPDGSADADGLSNVGNPYVLTGRRLDPETGLMQYRNRYYSADLGRFVSRDAIGYTDDTYNVFGYSGEGRNAVMPGSGRAGMVPAGP